MEYTITYALLLACSCWIAAAIDSNDIISDLFNSGNNINNINNNVNNLNPNDAGVLLNLGGNGGVPTGSDPFGGVYGTNVGTNGGYVDNIGLPTVPIVYDHYPRHQMSSVADLVNVVFGLGGHIVGRAGWIVRDALGALTTVGTAMNNALDMGIKGAALAGRLVTKGSFRFLDRRDGMAYSNYKLSDGDYGLMPRSLGGLRGGYGGGMYGTSVYPRHYSRFLGDREFEFDD